MDEIVLNKTPTKKTLKQTYPIFNWTFNLENLLFTYDFDAFNFLFKPKKSIKSMKDMLNIMSKEQQIKAKKTIKQVISTKKSTHFSCCIMPNSSTISYINFYIELDNSKLVKGTFQPSVIFSTQGEVANVYQQFFENHHHGMIITDDKTNILACNDYFEKQMGVNKGEFIGKKTTIFNAGKHSPEFYKNMWDCINNSGHWTGTILNKNPSGKISPHELTIQKIEVSEGRIIYLGLTVDLTKQLARVAENELGGIDLLTKLPTKDEYLKQLNVFCQKTGQHTGKIVLTIKANFNPNSIYEDQITLANALFHVRLCQVMGYLGQSVFSICAEYTIQQDVPRSRSIRAALRYLFQDLRFHSNKSVYNAVMSGKIGVSVLGLDSQSHTELVDNALQAMNELHAGEDKRLNFFHRATHEALERKKHLEKAVELSIRKERLHVYYQPIVDCQTADIIKFEALCRFPSVGDSSTNLQELISIAEDLDLITTLDQCISRKAIKDIPTIQSKFGEHVGITINCSLNTKSNTIEVINNLAELINKNTKTPNRVTVELTESAYFDSESNTSHSLEMLQDLGVSVAIDDFGTGYSSFSYLSKGQFDTLKIDKEFITNIHNNLNNFNIVRMITTLSHTLGVKVIAEGVETKEEIQCLQNLGIDYIQGFFFSKPKPIDELDSPEHYVEALKGSGLFNPLYQPIKRIAELSKNNIRCFAPDQELSTVYKYSNDCDASFMPVMIKKICVGVLTKEDINLHLSPTMGTTIETNKEAKIWNKTINQIMKVNFTEVQDTCSIRELSVLIKSKKSLPWVIVDEKGQYQGLVLESEVLNYLLTLSLE